MVMKRTTFFIPFEDQKAFEKVNEQLNTKQGTEFTISGRIRQLVKFFIQKPEKYIE